MADHGGHGRASHDRFHARGSMEEGTTTTPFDMVVLNRISRLHLCLDVLRHVPNGLMAGGKLVIHCNETLHRHHGHIREHFDDLPEIRDWTWSDGAAPGRVVSPADPPRPAA